MLLLEILRAFEIVVTGRDISCHKVWDVRGNLGLIQNLHSLEDRVAFKNVIKRKQNHGLDSTGSEQVQFIGPCEYEDGDSGSKREDILTS
jgi:hypothetical protein